MEWISIIVPIYHGRKYISGMIDRLEQCTSRCEERYKLELILSSDYLGETVRNFLSNKIRIKAVEIDNNRGIHGVKVRGLERCLRKRLNGE